MNTRKSSLRAFERKIVKESSLRDSIHIDPTPSTPNLYEAPRPERRLHKENIVKRIGRGKWRTESHPDVREPEALHEISRNRQCDEDPVVELPLTQQKVQQVAQGVHRRWRYRCKPIPSPLQQSVQPTSPIVAAKLAFQSSHNSCVNCFLRKRGSHAAKCETFVRGALTFEQLQTVITSNHLRAWT